MSGIRRESFPVFLVVSGPPLTAGIAWVEGHGGCGGLSWDGPANRIGCACGHLAFQVTEVAK